jgi:hypothetical protein
MFTRIVLALAALALLATAGLIVYVASPRSVPAIEASTAALPSAQATTDTSGISVSGTGRVRIKPNIATLSIGVETRATTLAEATSQANTRMTAVTEKIKSLGVADKDIQTTAFNITPLTEQKQGSAPVITGYRVNNQLSVTVRKIDDVGKILDAVVAAGANNVYGITFGVDDPAPYQQQARAAAIKDAQDKAGQLAKAAGVTLGKVISINEGGVSPSPILRAASAPVAMTMATTPVETGEMELTVTVEMRFGVQ